MARSSDGRRIRQIKIEGVYGTNIYQIKRRQFDSALQVECHPYYQQKELKKRIAKYGTILESWYPIGHGDTNKSSRSSVEMNDTSSRPALAASDFSVKEYDKVFLGFPIWWGTAPRVVQTFLEGQDFANKTIILFATSGSSGMGNTDKDLKPSVSASTKIVKGKMLNSNPSVEELKYWAQTME